MDKSSLVARLMAEHGYPARGAELIAEQVLVATPAVRQAFAHWWETGDLPELSVEGYTAQRLIAEHGMNPVAAILTLDWIARDPTNAMAAVRRGHDRVSFRSTRAK